MEKTEGATVDAKELFGKVDQAKLKAALSADDPDALRKLLADEGIELSDEQLDYIAGGSGPFSDDDGQTC